MKEPTPITPERKAELTELCYKVMELFGGQKATTASSVCLTLAARYIAMIIIDGVKSENVSAFMEQTLDDLITTIEANLILLGQQNGRAN